ncbi:hypothetical protein EMIT0194MI4_100137 [Pseudomonas sp. IT-194MI4]
MRLMKDAINRCTLHASFELKFFTYISMI